MKNSLQFAQREETPEYFAEPRDRAPSRKAPSVNPYLRPEPSDFAEAPEDAEPGQSGEAQLRDIVSELEAALWADLGAVASSLEASPADGIEPAPFAPPAAREEEDEEALDAAALQRLMASIRQPAPRQEEAGYPQGVASPSQGEPDDASPPSGPRSAPRRRPALGRPVPRRAAEVEPRPAATVRRLQSSVIVGAALVALAGGGAFMTVHSVTARDSSDPTPAVSQTAAQPDAVQAPAPVKSVERAPVETLDVSANAPDAVRVATANTEPTPAAGTPFASDAPVAAETPASPAVDAADVSSAETASAPDPTLSEPVAAERVASVDPQPPSPQAASPAKSVTGAIGAGPARITTGVRLRSNPDNGAPVVGVLSTGAEVTVVGCKGWCEVVAGDKRGYVYQKFLARPEAG